MTTMGQVNPGGPCLARAPRAPSASIADAVRAPVLVHNASSVRGRPGTSATEQKLQSISGRRTTRASTTPIELFSPKTLGELPNSSRCPHCQAIMPGARGIPLDVAQDLYEREWNHRPEKRWLSSEAKRLKCYHKAGRGVFILAKSGIDLLRRQGSHGLQGSLQGAPGEGRDADPLRAVPGTVSRRKRKKRYATC
jgi:hypothetical protein